MIQNGYRLTSKPPAGGARFRKKGARKNQKIQKLVDEGVIDQYEDFSIGTLAISMEFEEKSETRVSQVVPKRLICYGSLPSKVTQLHCKVFEGPKCHIQFLLWVF